MASLMGMHERGATKAFLIKQEANSSFSIFPIPERLRMHANPANEGPQLEGCAEAILSLRCFDCANRACWSLGAFCNLLLKRVQPSLAAVRAPSSRQRSKVRLKSHHWGNYRNWQHNLRQNVDQRASLDCTSRRFVEVHFYLSHPNQQKRHSS